MGRRVFALVVKELLTLLRDPKSRMVLIAPPLIQLLVFSYAATFDLNRVPIAIYDQDSSQTSRDLVARFLGAPSFRLRAMLSSDRRINELIDSRAVAMVLVIDRRFTRDLLTQRPAPVQVIVDGRNSNTALIIEGYVSSILTNFSLSWDVTHGVPTPRAVLDLRARYNPTLSSRWFIVPGIIAVLTEVVILLVVGLSVAREREIGTFDQLLVTPLRPIDILLGKSLPGLLIGIVEASAAIAATVWWFDVPLRGGLAALYVGLLLFATAVTGIGLMISSLASTQQQALLGAFLFMVPSIILSGFATPLADMPFWMQDLTAINPPRYFLVIIRSVFLEGAGVGGLAAQYWPMAAIGAVSLTTAAWLFRKRTG
jgi:drug efflux transport system permease protein